MKLVTRLTVAFLLIVVGVISLHEYRQFTEAQTDFESDMDRTHQLVASSLADAAAATTERDGLPAARQAIERAHQHRSGDVRIRWVCQPGVDDVQAAPVACSTLKDAPVTVTVDARRFTLAPISSGGRALGAIEVSESPDHERSWENTHLHEALLLALMTAGGMALAAFGLGFWLVARRTRALMEKARAVGRGELEPDLTLAGDDELSALAVEMNAMCRRIGEARDATAREAAARVAAVEQLRRADRLASVGRLASGLAHELGTPLNVIEARAGFIVEDTEADSSLQKSARIIMHCTEQVTKLVRQLLDFARPRKLERTTVPLDRLVRTISELIGPLASRRSVTLTVETPPVKVEGDEGLLQQAITNVVINAIHACANGGHVRVVTGTTHERGSDWASVTVTDDGVGMSEEVRARLLEPFFTTKAVGEGTGLGLPITASILEDHGGFMSVDSEPGKGSTFRLHVPLSRPAPSLRAGDAEAAAA